MPSKSRKQLNFFKLVKAYKEGGEINMIWMFREIFKTKKYPPKKLIEKVEKVSEKIHDSDLEDMVSGIDGEEILGDKRDIKVGYWMRFKAWYRPDLGYGYGDKEQNIFIARISRVNNRDNIANFKKDGLYNKHGKLIEPKFRTKITHPEFKYLDFAYFDQIEETAKEKKDLIMGKNNKITKKENIEEMVRAISKNYFIKLLSEEKVNEITHIVDSKGEPITTGKRVKELKTDNIGIVQGLAIDDNKKMVVRIKYTKTGKEERVQPSSLIVLGKTK